MVDSYLTIRQEATAEIKVKGSRFIGETCHSSSLDDVQSRLGAIRKREFNATHHCYAYRLGLLTEEHFKYSDDGEPSGTAGKPIYDVLHGTGVTDTLCVVTRYFGGTKLGTGGLVRAYGDAARAVLDASGVTTCYLTDTFRFKVDFTYYDRWQRIFHEIGGEVIESSFADHVTLTIQIRKSQSDRLTGAFVELTSGKGIFEAVQT